MATVINPPEKIQRWERERLMLLSLIAEAPITPLDIRPEFYKRYRDVRFFRGENLEDVLDRLILDERIMQDQVNGTINITPFGERLLKRYENAMNDGPTIELQPSPSI